jgi:hypothetical protein
MGENLKKLWWKYSKEILTSSDNNNLQLVVERNDFDNEGMLQWHELSVSGH